MHAHRSCTCSPWRLLCSALLPLVDPAVAAFQEDPLEKLSRSLQQASRRKATVLASLEKQKAVLLGAATARTHAQHGLRLCGPPSWVLLLLGGSIASSMHCPAGHGGDAGLPGLHHQQRKWERGPASPTRCGKCLLARHHSMMPLASMHFAWWAPRGRPCCMSCRATAAVAGRRPCTCCLHPQVVGKAVDSIVSQMNEAAVQAFDANIGGLLQWFDGASCKYNCLNYTQFPPSQRNCAAGTDWRVLDSGEWKGFACMYYLHLRLWLTSMVKDGPACLPACPPAAW